MPDSLLIRGATVLTMDEKDTTFIGDVLVEAGRITALGAGVEARGARLIDGGGRILLPGFVQTHVHLCQTLFRGAADDLSLIDWLHKRIWPLEAALTPESLFVAAQLGIAELIRGGTTCALTMETVRHTAAVFEAVEQTGFRAIIGKCMMDGPNVPDSLRESAADSVAESLALIREWHGRDDGRLRCCLAPRFAISCSGGLLTQVAELSRSRGLLVHTHASENRSEIAIVESETGLRNVAYLDSVGLAAPHVVLAHCVWLDNTEIEILRRTGTKVAHCPSSNLKLGSGIAPVPELLARGIAVSLGADGAPCNNRLDMFTEMRAASLIQKVLHGPEVMPAKTVLRMATIDGARAVGLSDEVGSIEPGKRADLLLLNVDRAHATPHADPASTIVYAAAADDVETVMINGRVVLENGQLLVLNERRVLDAANLQAAAVYAAAGVV